MKLSSVHFNADTPSEHRKQKDVIIQLTLCFHAHVFPKFHHDLCLILKGYFHGKLMC